MPITRADQSSGSAYSGNLNDYSKLGGTPVDFQSIYEKVKQENEKQERNKKPENLDKDLGGTDLLFANLNQLANNIRNAKGAQEEFNNTKGLAQFGAFLKTLPGGMLGSTPAFLSSAYEGLTRHNIQDVDFESGKMSSQLLDSEQAAGALANAAVEGAGALMGGSGRVLGAIGRGIGKAVPEARGLLGSVMPAGGKGIINKAFSEAGDSAGKAFAKQAAFDILEEGGEEYIQQYAENARSYDKDEDIQQHALEAAAWGALGGGLMSGVAGGAHYLMDKHDAKKARTASNNQIGPSNFDSTTGDEPKRYESPISNGLLPSAQKYASEQAFSDNEVPGSFGGTVIPGLRGQKTNDAILGIENFRAMWTQQGDKAHEFWSNVLGIDEKKLGNIIMQDDLDHAADQLEKIRANAEAKNGKLKIAVKRDPGTSDSHVIALNLAGVSRKTGMQMSVLASQLSNGDIDGDARYVMDYEGMHALYPTQLFSNPEGQPSSILEYMPNMDTHLGRKYIREHAENIFGSIAKNNKQFFIDLANNISKARLNSAEGDGSNAKQAATALMRLRQMIIEQDNPATPGQKYTGDMADDMISDFLSDIVVRSGDMDIQLSIINRFNQAVETTIDDSNYIRKTAPDRDYPVTSGSNEDIETMGDVWKHLGYTLSTARSKEEFLRDNQSLKYSMSKRGQILSSQLERVGAFENNELHRLIAQTLRLEDIGENVRTAARDLYNRDLEYTFINKLEVDKGVDNRIGAQNSTVTIDKFIEAYEEAQHEVRKKYKNAIESATTDGDYTRLLDLTIMGKVDYKGDKAHFMSSLMKTLSDANIRDYFAIPETSPYYNDTFGQAADRMLRDGTSSAPFGDLGGIDNTGKEASFLRELLSSVNADDVAVSRRFVKVMEQIPTMSIEEAEKLVNMPSAMWIGNSFYDALSPEVATYMQYQSWEDLMNHDQRRVILAGNGKDRTNLACAYTMRYKWSKVKALMNAKENGNQDITKDMITHQAFLLRDGTRLADMIAKQIEETGKSSLLESITDENISLDEKIEAYAYLQDTVKEDAEDFIVSCLKTGSTDLAMSEVSQRIQKISSSSKTSERLSNSNWSKQVNEFEKYIRDLTNTNEDISIEQVKQFIYEQQYKTFMQIPAAVFYDSTRMTLKTSEKGQGGINASLFAQQLDYHMYGGTYSYLRNVTAHDLGIMAPSDFATNPLALIDVLFEGRTIHIQDANTDADVDAQKICDDLLGKGAVEVKNGRLNIDQFLRIMHAAPAMFSHITGTMATVAPVENPSVVIANQGNPTEEFDGFVKKWKANSSSAKRVANRNKIRWDLISSPSYWCDIPYLIDLDGDVSPEKITKASLEATEKYIDNIMADAANERAIEKNPDKAKSAEAIANRRSQHRSEVMANAARDMQQRLEATTRITNLISTGRDVSSEALAETVASPDAVLDIIMDEKVEKLILDIAKNSGVDKYQAKDFVDHLAKDRTRYMFDRMAGSVNNAKRIAVNSVSMMGTRAWKSYMVSSLMEKYSVYEPTSDEAQNMIKMANSITDVLMDTIFRNDFVANNGKSLFLFDSACYKRDGINSQVYAGEMKKRVSNILSEYHAIDNVSYEEAANKIDSLAKIANDKRVPLSDRMKAIDDIERLRIEIVNIALSSDLRSIGAYNSDGSNYDAYYDADMFYDNYWKIVDKIAHNDDIDLDSARPVSDVQMPELRFANHRNSHMSLSAMFGAVTSPIMHSVAVNGNELNTLTALAALPHKIRCGDPGEKTTIGDLIARGLNNSGRSFEMTINGEQVIRRLNSSLNLNSLDPATEVILYSETCRCGMCHIHSKTIGAPGFEDSLDVFEAFSTLLDNSQEGANLKLKKMMKERDRIISKSWSHKSKISDKTYSPSANDTQEVIAQNAVKAITDMRDQLKTYLKIGFDSLGNKLLPVSDSECEHLSELLAYTARIEYIDADGNEKAAIVTMDELWSGKDNYHIPNRIDAAKITNIRAYITTPHMLNQKMSYDVANDRFNPDPKNKREITTDIMDDTLLRSVKDFSKYGAGELNIGNYLMSAPALRESFKPTLFPTDAPTPVQKYLKECGALNGYSESHRPRKPKEISNSKAELTIKKSDALVRSMTRNESGLSGTVTKVIMKDNTEEQQKYNSIREYRDTNKLVKEGFTIRDIPDACIIVGNIKTISNYLNDITSEPWAYDNILVPVSSVTPMNAMMSKERVMIGNEQFLVINTRISSSIAMATNKTFEYSCKPYDPSHWRVHIFDDAWHGQAANGDSAGKMAVGYFEGLQETVSTPIDIKLQWRAVDDTTATDILGISKYKEVLDGLNGVTDKKVDIVYQGRIDQENIRRMTIQFLENMSNNPAAMDSSGKYRAGSIHSETIFGFAYTTNAKAPGYIAIYPLTIEGNHPKINTITDLSITGNTVTARATSTMTFDKNGVLKGFIDGEGWKGEVVEVDPNDESTLYVPVGFPSDFKGYGTLDGLARATRLSNKGKMVLIDNCWGYSRTHLSSIRDSKIQFSNWAQRTNIESGDTNLNTLFSREINNALWREIVSGRQTIFARTARNKTLNDAIQKVASQALGGNGMYLPILLESYTVVNGEKKAKPRNYEDIAGILDDLSEKEIMALFNAMNPEIIGSPSDPSTFTENPGTLVRWDGKILCYEQGTKQKIYMPGRIIIPNFSKDHSERGAELGSGVAGKQTITKIGFRHGAREQDKKKFLDHILSSAGETVDWNSQDLQDQIKSVRRSMKFDYGVTIDFNMDEVNGAWGYTYPRTKVLESVDKIANTFENIAVDIVDHGSTVDYAANARFVRARESLKDALGSKNMSNMRFLNLVKCFWSISYQDGAGSMNLELDDIEFAVNIMTKRIDNGQYLIPGGTYKHRVTMPLIPRDVMEETFNDSTKLKDMYHDDFNEMVKAAKEEHIASKKEIENIKFVDKGSKAFKQGKQKAALHIMFMFAEKTHAMPMEAGQLFSGGIGIEDMVDANNAVLKAMLSEEMQHAIDVTFVQKEEARQWSEKMRAAAIDKKTVSIANDLARIGYENIAKNSDCNGYVKLLRNLEQLTMLNIQLNPLMLVPNIVETGGHTLILKAAMALPEGISPYNQKSALSKGASAEIAQNPELLNLWKLLSTMKLMGKDQDFIIGYQQAPDKEEFIDAVYKGRSPFSRFTEGVFRFMSGSDITSRYQLEIFLDKLGQNAVAKGIEGQTIKVPDSDMSFMEHSLRSNPTEWLLNCMLEDSPMRRELNNALNTSQGVAMARENAVSLIMEEVFDRMPIASFLNTAFFSPFYRYGTNFTGRILNWALPMSSIHYMAIQKLQTMDHLGPIDLSTIDFYEAQNHADLKSAVIADAMHLSIPTMVILLVTGFGAALQPPEDESKMNDYREWTFFGLRIAPEWWLSDILGPSLPMACCLKTFLDGKPRLDVLFQGLGTVIANNPIMRIGDLVDMICNPDALAENWQDTKDNYQNAPGGSPSELDQIFANGWKYGLTCFGRFITPSWIREIQNNTLKYEKSYKRVYAKGVTGVDAESLQSGDTVRVPYEEAMLRQVTRNNPVLGFIMDVIRHPSTSYIAGGNPFLNIQGMPNVDISDPIQYYIKNKYSIYEQDENGEYVEKSESQKQKVALDIIATLESYDDMEELYNMGFMIDESTRAYVSDVLRQIVKEKQDSFYAWFNSAESSSYVLGGGDYWTGRQKRQEAYDDFLKDIDHYKQELYYDKLWSYEMRKGVQKYARMNTTYHQDMYGDWYASGFPRTDLNPTGFAFAQGSLYDDDGTMGYEGDWATPSAVVNGQSTGERALIALHADADKVPDFDDESNSDNSNGSRSTTNNGSATVASNPYDQYYMNSRGRSGGGGSGSYSPNLYSRLPNLNVNSPRQSSSGNLRDTEFDYLRPNFETKGSREASRRSDF